MPGKLTPYQRKRDFSRTPEPAGQATGQPGGAADRGDQRFVVQRHRARRLHYDLRFEIGGVLVSWAVPKGPTLDPDIKRIAVHVEDHPLEYFDFEGVIPRGQYGAGDVIVWDRGTWEPHATDDPAAAVEAGEFHADVYGEKLRGRLILVRTGGPDSDQWLLMHKHDEYAVKGWDPEDFPASVLSGRTNDQVKADPDRMWRSDLPPSEASVTLRSPDGSPGPPAGHQPDSPAAGPSPDELAALDALGAGGTWHVFGRDLRLTNLDKVLFPGRPGETPASKRELIRYAAQIAPVALPYLSDRALNMHRFPGGADTKGFWHKQLPDHAPGWLPRWHDPEAGPDKTTTYLVVNEPAALVWAANFGALEWDELDDPAPRPDAFTIRTIPDRVARLGDPFRTVLGPGQVLPPIS